jgi:MFS family permease
MNTSMRSHYLQTRVARKRDVNLIPAHARGLISHIAHFLLFYCRKKVETRRWLAPPPATTTTDAIWKMRPLSSRQSPQRSQRCISSSTSTNGGGGGGGDGGGGGGTPGAGLADDDGIEELLVDDDDDENDDDDDQPMVDDNKVRVVIHSIEEEEDRDDEDMKKQNQPILAAFPPPRGGAVRTSSSSDHHYHHGDTSSSIIPAAAVATSSAGGAVVPTVVVVVPPWYILPTIVVSQFAGTALWFATNAILPALHMEDQWIGVITSSVQLGFILGTLISALTNIADYIPPTRLFATASLVGAGLNMALTYWHTITGLIVIRLLTGVCLAGIYPIGMKIASDWYPQPGKALGYLVGALVLGTATPFLLDALFAKSQPWMAVLWETSALAVLGGLAMVAIVPPSGPYRKPGTRLGDPLVVIRLFRSNPAFRGAAFGYFGHMWEAYAFWTWCAMVWKAYLVQNDIDESWNYNLVTFAVIVSGTFGCILGGHVSEYTGSAVVAFVSLAISGLFCLVSPLLFITTRPRVVLALFLVWGAAVAADSPQFSSLVAQSAPPEHKGTALTIVNSIGFAITVLSIQLLGSVPLHKKFAFLLLAPGPLLGLYSMRRHVFPTKNTTTTTTTRSSMDDDVTVQKNHPIHHYPEVVQLQQQQQRRFSSTSLERAEVSEV